MVDENLSIHDQRIQKMDQARRPETIRSEIWQEIAEEDNPFAAAVCYCRGYDVFGDLLATASWAEYLYLLFIGERPNKAQAALLEKLAVVLANPGLRDHSVRAAMNGGVGGSTNGASLMAALAVGAGELGGAREVVVAIQCWQECGHDLDAWSARLRGLPDPEELADVWLPMEHPPGFDPDGASCSTPVRQALDYLSGIGCGNSLVWMRENRELLEQAAECPLALSGVAAAALHDLEFTGEKAEMLYLLLRLPGAAVHALEQKKYGWRHYPFFLSAVELSKDPGADQLHEAG